MPKLSDISFPLLWTGMSAVFLWIGVQAEFFEFALISAVFLLVGLGMIANLVLPNFMKQGSETVVGGGVHIGLSAWHRLVQGWHRATFGFFSGLDRVRNQLHDPIVEPTEEEKRLVQELAGLLRRGDPDAALEHTPVSSWTRLTYDAVLIELWRPGFSADPENLDLLLAQVWLHAPEDSMMRADLLHHIERHGLQGCQRALDHVRRHGNLDVSGDVEDLSQQVEAHLEGRLGPLPMDGGGGQLSLARDPAGTGGLSLSRGQAGDVALVEQGAAFVDSEPHQL